MRTELEKLNSRLGGMSGEEKDLLIRRLLEENSELEARLEVANSAAAELAVQFQQVKDENAALKKDKKELTRQNRNLTDQLQKRKKNLASLPVRTVYDFDADALDRKYGEGNWRIAFWRKEEIRNP
jgi:chromosome segregation ATPase